MTATMSSKQKEKKMYNLWFLRTLTISPNLNKRLEAAALQDQAQLTNIRAPLLRIYQRTLIV
jgi:hypothetical protein